MNEVEKLTRLFEMFPGVGPRQARRFVYFLLKNGHEYRRNLLQAVQNLSRNIQECEKCSRYFAGEGYKCSICANPDRNNSGQLMIVEKDVDLEQMEKVSAYNGIYYVLGAKVKLTDNNYDIRSKDKLIKILHDYENLREVILALPATTEGEHTARIVKNIVKSVAIEKRKNIKITMLGRGLSTGSELEYADSETLRNALESRVDAGN